MLKDRSGLMLSADKKYLLESRLLPLARKAGVCRHHRSRCENEGRQAKR